MSTLEEKIRARRQVRWAIESGKLTKEPCINCGSPEVFAHHEDYGEPLKVMWVCRTCHAEIHRVYPVHKICLVCGAVFTPHRTKRKRAKSCSPACRLALVTEATRLRMRSPEGRQAARELAFANGSAERAKTLVLRRWAKRDEVQ